MSTEEQGYSDKLFVLEGTYEEQPLRPVPQVKLNSATQTVSSIAYVPLHSLIVAASLDTYVRVYCEDSRDPYLEFKSHFSAVRGVVHLFDRFVASIDDYGNLITWNVIHGHTLETHNVFGNAVHNILANGSPKNDRQMEGCKIGVYSLVKLNDSTLVVGTKENRPIYITHSEGKMMSRSTEAGKGYQTSYMTDIAVFGPKMVTASNDNSIVIRETQTRIVLCKVEVSSGVLSTAINARYIAAGCNNGYLYIVRNAEGFELEYIFKEKNDKLLTLTFIDSEILMVGGTSGYLSFISIAGRCYLSRIRIHMDKYIYSALLLPGGRVAVGGGKGETITFALVVSIPSEISSILQDKTLPRVSHSPEVSLELRKVRDFIDQFSNKTMEQLRRLTIKKDDTKITQADKERERAEKLLTRASSETSYEDLVENLRNAVRPLACSHNEARNLCEEIDEFVLRTEDRLKCLRVSVDALEKTLDDPVCVFCLESILPGDIVIRLKCMHLFHRDCIIPYFQQQFEPCCPIDRKPVNLSEIIDLPVWKYGEGEKQTRKL